MRRTSLVAMVLIGMCVGACGPDRTAVAPPAPPVVDDADAPAAVPAAHPTGAPVAVAAPGAAANQGAPAVANTAPAARGGAVNSRDPIDGLPVDPAIPPIVVVIDEIRPALTVVIGVSSAENGKRVESEPKKYAAAAMHNAIARKDIDSKPGGY